MVIVRNLPAVVMIIFDFFVIFVVVGLVVFVAVVAELLVMASARDHCSIVA